MNNINTAMKRPNIIVLGANGQVGYSLVVALHSFANIISITRNELDISNLSELSNFLQNLKTIPAIIINASAYTAVDKAEQEKDLCASINYHAVELIAIYCKDKNIPLIHYSTDYVFDGNKEIYTENDEPNPINIYGKTKLLGEQAIQKVNPAYFIFRTSWVYDSRGNNFLLTMLRLSQTRTELKVVNDQFGSPTWAYTIANITSYIIMNYILNDSISVDNYSGVYNLVSDGYTNWADYARKIFEYMNKDVKVIVIPSSEYQTPAKRPQYSILNTEKIQNTFNIVLPKWENALKYCMRGINTN